MPGPILGRDTRQARVQQASHDKPCVRPGLLMFEKFRIQCSKLMVYVASSRSTWKAHVRQGILAFNTASLHSTRQARVQQGQLAFDTARSCSRRLAFNTASSCSTWKAHVQRGMLVFIMACSRSTRPACVHPPCLTNDPHYHERHCCKLTPKAVNEGAAGQHGGNAGDPTPPPASSIFAQSNVECRSEIRR